MPAIAAEPLAHQCLIQRYRRQAGSYSRQRSHNKIYKKDLSMKPHQKTFDRIRNAVLPEFRERVADYLVEYENVLQDPAADTDQARAAAQQLRGYLRGLNTTRVLGMEDWEDLDRRVAQEWPLGATTPDVPD